MVVSGKFAGRFAERSQIDALNSDDFERPPQPLQVIVEPKQLPAERPQLFRDGNSLHKAGVIDRDHQRGFRDKLTVQVGEARHWDFRFLIFDLQLHEADGNSLI